MANEACERYSYYALRSVLLLYLTDKLGFGDNFGMSIVSGFITVGYISPLFGGYIADSYWGKFKTIVTFSLVYVAGAVVLALSAIPFNRWMALLGLAGIAIGMGGIKPCVSAFGADQFHTTDAQGIATYFSAFYMTINVASFFSYLITPVLRTEFSYFMAFICPAGFLFLAILIFLAASNSYIIFPPSGSLFAQLWPTIRYVYWTVRSRPDRISLAAQKFGRDNAEMVRALTIVIPVFSYLPFFWSVYDLQAGAWVLQAKDMKLYGLQPEQMGVLNTVCILIFVPALDRCVYPCLRRRGYGMSHKVRLWLGMVFAGFAMGATTFVQFMIETNTEDAIPVFFQIPQYILMAIAEALLSVTALEYAYVNAPDQLKGLISSMNLVTTALGDLLITIIFAVCAVFGSLSLFQQFIVFSCIIGVAAVLFWCMQVEGGSKAYVSFEDDLPLPDPAPERNSGDALIP